MPGQRAKLQLIAEGARIDDFSGVASEQEESVNGTTLEWYQPIHEPGNVFSYPWNLTELEDNQSALTGSTLNLLTSSTPAGFFTDSSALTEMTNWSGQQTQSVSSGNDTQISWGTSLSASYTPPRLTGGPLVSRRFSYSGSDAFGGLKNSTTTLGQSTGLGVTKPGTFANPDEYQYAIFPYIFGDEPAPGSLDSVSDFPPTVPVTTSGILQADYAADPTNSAAGAWWHQTYSVPDLALAHPARWNIVVENNPSPLPNCLETSASSSTSDCAQFAPLPAPSANDSNIWTAESLWMRGFLITGADANGQLLGQGPQLPQATAGDKVLLQARIYNDSLADIPSTDTIVVRFYGEPWDPGTETATGNAFLIDTQTLDGLPGFNSPSATPSHPN